MNKQTTVNEMPEYGDGKNRPKTISTAIKPGTRNLGSLWMRSNAGALMSVTRLRSAECVTTGTAGLGFFGLFAWPITQVKHGIA